MTNEATGGVSKRSLVLLGAFAALALNRDVRRGLVQGTRDAVQNAQGTLDDTVKPALSTAAQQTGQTFGHLLEGASHTIDTLREEAPGRAQSLLGTAQEVAGTVAATAAARAAQARKDAEKAAKRARKEYGPRLSALSDDLLSSAENARKEAGKTARQVQKQVQKEYGPRLNALGEDLRDLADDRRHDAERAMKNARKSSRGLIGQLGQKASTLLDDVQSDLQDERDDIQYRVNRARRKAEKELRRSGKKWNAKKLQKAVDRQVSPLQKEASKQLALLDKQARKYRHEPRRAGMSGSAGTLLVLGGGAIALARLPQARQAIMDAVSSVSPETADTLHGAGQKIRGVVGDFWIERDAVKTSTAIVPASQFNASQFGNSHLTDQAGTEHKTDLDDRPPAADKNGSPTRNN